jgi:predicted metal-dependent hydrolase
MMTRQAEMHGKDMEFLDDTIKRLNASQELIARTLETSVDEGIARAEKQRELTAAAAALEQATTTMRTVVGKMSNEAVSDGPTKPAANGQQKPRAAERAPS